MDRNYFVTEKASLGQKCARSFACMTEDPGKLNFSIFIHIPI